MKHLLILIPFLAGLTASVQADSRTEVIFADGEGRVVKQTLFFEGDALTMATVQELSEYPLQFELGNQAGPATLFRPRIHTVSDYEKWRAATPLDIDQDGDMDLPYTESGRAMVMLNTAGELRAQPFIQKLSAQH